MLITAVVHETAVKKLRELGSIEEAVSHGEQQPGADVVLDQPSERLPVRWYGELTIAVHDFIRFSSP